MLSDFYNQKITIKFNRTGTPYDGFTYQTKVIDGAVQYKAKKVINVNGDEVVSNSQLFTNEKLSHDDIIVWTNRDRQIIDIFEVFDHFSEGKVDHYEVLF